MSFRSFGGALMAGVVGVLLAGSVQPAEAAGTSIHQYRLNEFTGLVDEFGDPSLTPILTADPDGPGPAAVSGPTGVTTLGSDDAAPAALGVASASGCATAAPGAATRFCQAYAFGFSQGLTIESGSTTAREAAGKYRKSSIVIEMLVSDGRLRRILDF